jgi:hypothetical protein
MRIVVVYESMYGNTHRIAEAIARGLEPGNTVAVVPVAEADRELLAAAELVVVGGPTHVHGMSRERTRAAAAANARKPGSGLTVETGAEGPGLREWFAGLDQVTTRAAAFDTRLSGLAILTGRAAKDIRGQLRRHGFTMIAPAQSFLVATGNRLLPGEEDRARAWGTRLAGLAAASGAIPADRG